MKYNNISLPYPVLGINDDIYPLLKDDCISMPDPIKSTISYLFRIHLKQENETINNLISTGQAEYACEITCKDTYLRKCIHSATPDIDIELPRTSINGRVNFKCFIAVKEALHGYSNPEFNEDYRGFTFDLEVGDLLAIFPNAFYNTNIKFDKLFAAGSFMQIVEGSEDLDKTWFNLDEDKILIELPHNLYVTYQKIGNCYPEIIHSSLVHNALVYALCNLGEYQDKGKLWADSLMIRMGEPELQEFDLSDIAQVYKAADILLKDPYKRLLETLESLNESINE